MISYTVLSKECSLMVYAKGQMQSETIIIFLHGGPGSGAQAMMEKEAFAILEQKYGCIYFDQRGSGLSEYDIRRGLRIDLICHDVHMIIKDTYQRYHPRHIFLWGGSFGACLASLYIERYHDIVDGIILCSPPLTFNRKQSLLLYNHMQTNFKKRLPILYQNMIQQGIDIEPEVFLQNTLVKNFIYSAQNPSSSAQHLAAMADWFFQYDYSNCFNHLKVATLILFGDHDNVCDGEMILSEFQTIANPYIYCHLLQSCGHSIFDDQKAEFIKLIDQFILQNSYH